MQEEFTFLLGSYFSSRFIYIIIIILFIFKTLEKYLGGIWVQIEIDCLDCFKFYSHSFCPSCCWSFEHFIISKEFLSLFSLFINEIIFLFRFLGITSVCISFNNYDNHKNKDCNGHFTNEINRLIFDECKWLLRERVVWIEPEYI